MLLILRSLTVGSGVWLLFPCVQNALKVFSTSVYEWSDFKTSKIPNYFGTCFPFVQLSLVMFLSYILEHTGLCISNANRTSVHSMCFSREMKHNYSNPMLFIFQDLSFLFHLLSVSHVHCTLCVYFYLNKCNVYFLCF